MQHQQPPPIFTQETVLDTGIEDLHITGEHSVPQWLHEPEPPAIIATVACSLADGGNGGSSGEGVEQR